MLESHKIFQKKGLGFSKYNKTKGKSKRSNQKKTNKYYGFINCFYYNQRQHHIKDCFYKNRTYVLKPNEKLLWLPKVSTSKSYPLLNTNSVGPNAIWVPSSKV